MRNLLSLCLAVLIGFGLASTAPCCELEETARCPGKALCPSPPQNPTPPPEFEFPEDADVDVDVSVDESATAPAGDSTIATILSAIAALGGAASGYFGTREDPDEPEVGADDVVPEPDGVV